MWKLFNRLFGWDYAAVSWAFGDTLICRIHFTGDGRPYVVPYSTPVFFDDNNRRWVPMTRGAVEILKARGNEGGE